MENALVFLSVACLFSYCIFNKFEDVLNDQGTVSLSATQSYEAGRNGAVGDNFTPNILQIIAFLSSFTQIEIVAFTTEPTIMLVNNSLLTVFASSNENLDALPLRHSITFYPSNLKTTEPNPRSKNYLNCRFHMWNCGCSG